MKTIDLIEQTIYKTLNLTESDIGELLLPMGYIVKTSSNEIVKRISTLVQRIIETPPSPRSSFSHDKPFSNFAMIYGAKNNIDVNFAISRIIIEYYRIIDGKERSFYREWAVQKSYTAKPSNLGVLIKLFFCMYLSKDMIIGKKQFSEGLSVIYTRVKQQGDGLANVLSNLSITVEELKEDSFISKGIQELLNSFIQISYKYPDPEVRENCAKLVRVVIESGENIDKKIIDTLKYDARARVRRVFTN